MNAGLTQKYNNVSSSFSDRVQAGEKCCLQSLLEYWQQWRRRAEGGKLFQTCDAEKGNAQSPVVGVL